MAYCRIKAKYKDLLPENQTANQIWTHLRNSHCLLGPFSSLKQSTYLPGPTIESLISGHLLAS